MSCGVSAINQARRDEECWETYNPPKPKTAIRIAFWRLGSCKPFKTGKGKVAVAISVTMLTAAFENLVKG